MRGPAAVGWAAAAALAVRGLAGTANSAASWRWLRNGARPVEDGAAGGGPRFVLVVPLLREQRLVAAVTGTLAALARSWPRTVVALVTTEAEYAQGVGRAGGTPELAAGLAARNWAGTTVRHWHYPETDGVMAHQVNYAVRCEMEQAHADGVGPERLFFAVYNADSVPHPHTLRVAAALIMRLADAPGGPARIMQQSAVFTGNLTALPGGGRGAVLAGAAWLQSRWTMAREIPRLRRQSRQARSRRPGRWPRLAHCVGHGLIVRADVFVRLGGLPESTWNEDLPFGYLACAAGIPIDPLPVLEVAQSPDTVGAWITQGRRWFRSYTQYPHAAALAAAHGLGDPRRRRCLTAQGIARGAVWLGQSPALAAALALPLVTARRQQAAALVGGGLLTYYALPAALAAHATGGRLRPGRWLPGGIAAALLSSLGPWWSLAELAAHAGGGTRPAPGKTER